MPLKMSNPDKYKVLASVTLLLIVGISAKEARSDISQNSNSIICSTEERLMLEESGVLELPTSISDLVIFDQSGRQVKCSESEVDDAEVISARNYIFWSIQNILSIADHVKYEDYLCEPVEVKSPEGRLIVIILPNLEDLSDIRQCARKIQSSQIIGAQ